MAAYSQPFLQLQYGLMGGQVQLLFYQLDLVHGTGGAPGAETGGDVFFFAELQAGVLVVVERAKGFPVPVHPDAEPLGHLHDRDAGFDLGDFHVHLTGLVSRRASFNLIMLCRSSSRAFNVAGAMSRCQK